MQSFSALRHRNYRWYWASAIGNSAAMGMQQLTIAWLILELTDSLAQFGSVLFLQGVPQLIFMFYGGALADRLDRIKLLMGSAIAITIIITIIATLSATGHIQIWHVYASAVCLGLINAINTPTRQAIIGSLVPREDLVNAIALNATLMNFARIAGPSATGFIIEGVGISTTLYINTAFYALAVLCQTQIGKVKVEARARKTGVFKDIIDGIKYTKSNAPAWAVVILGFSAGMFTFPTSQIIPAFAREVLTLDASGAGLLQMTTGIGALTASLSLTAAGGVKRKNILFIAASFLCGIGLFGFAVSQWFALSIFFLFVVGFGTMAFVNMGVALLQLLVPREYTGRVLSLWFAGGAFISIGVLPLTAIGDLLSLRWSLAGSAVIGLVLALLLGVIWPPLRRISPDLESQQKQAAPATGGPTQVEAGPGRR